MSESTILTVLGILATVCVPLFGLIMEVVRQLATLNTKLDTIIEKQREDHEALSDRVNRLEEAGYGGKRANIPS